MNIAQLELEHSHLTVERLQCRDEGLDIGPLEAEFDRLLNADLSQPGNQAAAQRLLDATITRPRHTDHPFIEPSDLNGIQTESDNSGEDPPFIPDPDDMQNRVSGAWLAERAAVFSESPWRDGDAPASAGISWTPAAFPCLIILHTAHPRPSGNHTASKTTGLSLTSFPPCLRMTI